MFRTQSVKFDTLVFSGQLDAAEAPLSLEECFPELYAKNDLAVEKPATISPHLLELGFASQLGASAPQPIDVPQDPSWDLGPQAFDQGQQLSPAALDFAALDDIPEPEPTDASEEYKGGPDLLALNSGQSLPNGELFLDGPVANPAAQQTSAPQASMWAPAPQALPAGQLPLPAFNLGQQQQAPAPSSAGPLSAAPVTTQAAQPARPGPRGGDSAQQRKSAKKAHQDQHREACALLKALAGRDFAAWKKTPAGEAASKTTGKQFVETAAAALGYEVWWPQGYRNGEKARVYQLPPTPPLMWAAQQ